MPSVKIKHGYLYLANLNPRFGSEAGKVRPVLVIQSDLLNQAEHPSTWIVPCTTNLTGESVLRVVLPAKIAGNKQECELMIDQSRAIDNQRLTKQLGFVPLPVLHEVKEKLRLVGSL